MAAPALADLTGTEDTFARGRLESSTMITPASRDFAPLCNGRVLLSDMTSSRILLLDVPRGAVEAIYPLPSAPERLPGQRLQPRRPRGHHGGLGGRPLPDSLDNSRLVATDRRSLELFDVATHVRLQTTPGLGGCSYADHHRVGISRGGRLLFGFASCGPMATTGILVWARAP